jgi:hypothetical protein
MAYTHTNSKGNTYVLHGKVRTLKSGKETTLYYFAKEAKADALDAVPTGYKVSETSSGMLVLKKTA